MVAALCGTIGAVGTVLGFWNQYVTRGIKLYIERCRREDKEELLAWINGSFQRSKVIEPQLADIKHDIEDLQVSVRLIERRAA